MNMIKRFTSLTLLSLVMACGGGGGAGTSPFGTGSGSSGSGGSTGGTGSAANAASDLILTLDMAQIQNTGSATANATATVIDANRNTLSGVPVTISADADAIVTGGTGSTGVEGTLTAKVGIGADKGNRLITVTATSGSVTKTATVQVVGTTIESVLVPAIVAPSTAAEVRYRVLDKAGNPMANQPVQIVATGLTPAAATGKTGGNGDFVFAYTSASVAGSHKVIATIGGQSDTQTVQVQTAGTVDVVNAVIQSASVSANPSVVAVNLPGSEVNRSEIRALFLGANNLPVKNVRVRFDLNGDINSIGGKFTTGSTTLYSDANGVVTSAYVPGTRSSPTDGVTVRACYGASETDPNFVNCLTSKLVTLTVTAEPLGVTIGTNETIVVNELTYVKKFVVSVSDAAGVAKADVNLVVSLDLPTYRKGRFVVKDNKWVKNGTVLVTGDAAICLNEDTNRNGVLEAGEDFNVDGQLWPRKPDVTVSLLQSKTGADGTAVLQIQYAKDHASWVDAMITVSASGVAGTEGRATYLVAPVPVEAAAIMNTSVEPAFLISPYGRSANCNDRN